MLSSGGNPCTNNGGCSHLCLLIPNGFQCACPETGDLLPDQKNCKMRMYLLMLIKLNLDCYRLKYFILTSRAYFFIGFQF